ncbi:MAG: phospho-sugar mutase [Planctomyces sp.]
MTSQPAQDVLNSIEQAAAAGLLTADSPANLKTWLSRESLAAWRPRILQLIAAGQWAELDAMFWTSIPFGTGGRRGPMGEMGPATINDRTIAESAHGMAVYLRSTGVATGGSVVIAHDTRHNSARFARIAACTFAAHGLQVWLFDGHRATPALSFAVRRLGCSIGVMISASHNPPADNGFKAYWTNGGQVIPPHDKGIIREVERADEIPTADYQQCLQNGSIKLVGAELDQAYTAEVVRLSESANRSLPAIFTPLHGVGETSVYAVIRAAGFTAVDIFEPHRAADGSFPNVPRHLPNPENLEVFDPVITWVSQHGHPAQLILASDPDADRLGVMVRGKDGQFVSLSGNQVGALITDYLFRRRKASGRFSPQDYVVETLVTTPLTRAVAEYHGARCFHELLVGFKYIAQTMEEQGTSHFVFGTEESIGFLAGDYCRDKDAAVCALYILELAGELHSEGRTLLDQLDTLHTQCGYFCEGQTSIYCEGPTGKAKIDGLMQTLRQQPPAAFGPIRIVQADDYLTGTRTEVPAGQPLSAITSPRGDLLIYHSDPTAPVRIQIAGRPSGTEPKIKFYFFCQSDLVSDLQSARNAGNAALKEAQQALKTWADGQLSAG